LSFRHRPAGWIAVTLAVLACLASCTGNPAEVRQDGAALPARPGHYLGVYEPGSDQSWTPVQAFATAVGHQPDIVLMYSNWFERFQRAFAERAAAHGAIPMIQLQPMNISLPAIVAGRYDTYLRSYATAVRSFGHPVILSFAHEMNGNWYSWGYPHVSPAVWVAAWRHVVSLFRSLGANNVTWLWAPNAEEPGAPPLSAYWPGARYVTWVGLDGYLATWTDTFSSVFSQSIGAIRRLTAQPLLIAETAVGPVAGQVVKIGEIFSGMQQYRLLGIVWFDVAQHGGITRQDWRLEGNPAALAEFRSEVRRYW
jgi:hypothetical protein